MAQALLKRKTIEETDRIVNGVRLFNPSKPHGTVYADGYCETKYVQEYQGREVYYRGDNTPIGENPDAVIPAKDLARENAELKARLAQLEAPAAQTPASGGSDGRPARNK